VKWLTGIGGDRLLYSESGGTCVARVIIGTHHASGRLYGQIGDEPVFGIGTDNYEEAQEVVQAVYILTGGEESDEQ